MKKHLAIAALSGLTLAGTVLAIPAASTVQAATPKVQPKRITINGTLVLNSYGIVIGGTTYMPIAYVMTVIAELGYQSTWDGTTWSITAPPGTPIDLSNMAKSSGPGAIRLNGTVVCRLPKLVLPDPRWHNATTWMPIWNIMMALQRVGIGSSWDGTTWSMTTPPPISVTVAPPAQYPTLYQGKSGYPVVLLQQRLNAAGYSVGPIDGVFGTTTRITVQAFQRQHALNPDGIVGPRTWLALNQALAAKFSVLTNESAPPTNVSGPAASSGIDAQSGTSTSPADSHSVMAWVTDASSMQAAEKQPDITEIHDDHYAMAASGTISATPGLTSATAALLQYARSHHVKLYATITNIRPDTGNFDGTLVHQLVSNAAAQAQFRASALALCAQGYDGIDIDFESVAPSDRSAFLALLADLSSDLHAAGKSLSITVPARTGATAEPWSAAYDYAAIGNLADEVPIMAYDFSWQGGSAGPIAPLSWDQNILEYALTQMPASKVRLGLGLYGYDWDVIRGGPARALSLGAVDHLMQSTRSTETWNAADAFPYFTYTDTGGDVHQVYYENEASLAAKLQLASQDGVTGVAVWHAGLETPLAWSAIDAWLHADD
ncbi:MAG: peptidoglycan-binding protein [Thermoflavifilum sp.]|nr:peptidoglycan-binding protein [Thermoflavifilum sp.]MCL6514512.1 peptidoglycan-binding protein [Alicyclobacillus sp.]